MKYPKRSLKKQRQRHHFSKKYAAQRGGGFMEVIREINATEGRMNMNTCMAVHPTEPLVVVGDDAGTVTLWEINYLGEAPPKRLAQLIGLSSAVKCVEFHKTLPVVAAACGDMVLMWRFDQINREEEERLEPSHTVIVLHLRNLEVVQQELSETKIILEENDRNIKPIFHDQVTIENNLRDIKNKITAINEGRQGIDYLVGMADRINTALKQIEDSKKEEKLAMTAVSTVVFMTESARRIELDLRQQGEDVKKQLEPLRQQLKSLQEEQGSMEKKLKELSTRSRSITEFITEQEKKKRELETELGSIRANARYDVSCIAFHPGRVLDRNMSYIAVGVNNDQRKNENRIIMCRFEIESSSVEKIDSIRADSFFYENRFPDVSLASFSHDGMLFAFVTKSYGGTVLKVMIFNGSNTNYHSSKWRIDIIDQHATSIVSYKSSNSGGGQYQHQFIIGRGNGSLLMTQATTVTTHGFSETNLTNLVRLHVWNSGESIECVAVHPNLPLFASGSRSAAKLWDIDEPRAAIESLVLQDVRSVGLNQNFLAVCGPRSMRFYSCTSDDYSGFKIEMQEKLKRKKILHELHNGLRDKALKGRCSVCLGAMTDQLQPAITTGSPEEVETYLQCGHKFHQKCIEQWLGRTCPECRAMGSLPQSTPRGVVIKRGEELPNLEKEFNDYVERNIAARRAVFTAPTSPESTVLMQEQFPIAPPQPPSEGGRRKNKYSRKKYSSTKSKIRRRYSNKK
jgi:WD40 repeat protein